jgi:hypothetical protein
MRGRADAGGGASLVVADEALLLALALAADRGHVRLLRHHLVHRLGVVEQHLPTGPHQLRAPALLQEVRHLRERLQLRPRVVEPHHLPPAAVTPREPRRRAGAGAGHGARGAHRDALRGEDVEDRRDGGLVVRDALVDHLWESTPSLPTPRHPCRYTTRARVKGQGQEEAKTSGVSSMRQTRRSRISDGAGAKRGW